MSHLSVRESPPPFEGIIARVYGRIQKRKAGVEARVVLARQIDLSLTPQVEPFSTHSDFLTLTAACVHQKSSSWTCFLVHCPYFMCNTGSWLRMLICIRNHPPK